MVMVKDIDTRILHENAISFHNVQKMGLFTVGIYQCIVYLDDVEEIMSDTVYTPRPSTV